MFYLFVAVAPIAVLLVLSEVLWRAKILRGEAARKLLHIIIGSYVASWPFFLTKGQIELVSLALFVGVSISHRFKIFHAIIDIKRKSVGDLLYALGIGLTAFLAGSPWIFAAAIMHMSIGDGLAGLIGTSFGKKSRYKVLGQDKSIVGSTVFLVCSVAILYVIVPTHLHVQLGYLIAVLPLAATLAENIGVLGVDNVLVPVLITLSLNALV